MTTTGALSSLWGPKGTRKAATPPMIKLTAELGGEGRFNKLVEDVEGWSSHTHHKHFMLKEPRKGEMLRTHNFASWKQIVLRTLASDRGATGSVAGSWSLDGCGRWVARGGREELPVSIHQCRACRNPKTSHSRCFDASANHHTTSSWS